jgi:hypothetical protein
MYVIKNGNGKYVSKPGSYYSYTDKIEKARIFKTKEATIDSKCENEYVVAVSDILR